jgi:hypothetical protein
MPSAKIALEPSRLNQHINESRYVDFFVETADVTPKVNE